MASVDGLSYTVTGLTTATSYNVTVFAINTCCGAGPVSDVVMVMTNMRPPPTTSPTTSYYYYYHYSFAILDSITW